MLLTSQTRNTGGQSASGLNRGWLLLSMLPDGQVQRPTSLCTRYAMSGTELAVPTSLCACSAMSGADHCIVLPGAAASDS
eukprot:2093431-Rhodomonas_salina.1